MNAKELAVILNGREYTEEITKEERSMAKENNLVVVFGASDDLIEFSGAIEGEVQAFDGGTAYLDKNGLAMNACYQDDCPYFLSKIEKMSKIHALWCEEEGFSFTYKTEIPHETFEIVEDDHKYCRGIVFSLDDVV